MKISKLSIFTTLVVLGTVASAQNEVNANKVLEESPKIYQVETRLDNYTRPITFTPTKATAVNGSITENIVTTTQNILNI